jgi:hypothetical protein
VLGYATEIGSIITKNDLSRQKRAISKVKKLGAEVARNTRTPIIIVLIILSLAEHY